VTNLPYEAAILPIILDGNLNNLNAFPILANIPLIEISIF
jgi:hypothetical protein